MFERGLNRGDVPVIVEEHDVTVHDADDPLPALHEYDGVIMTGSPAFVGDDAPWMRWGARVLDCDIVLWDGGAWSSPRLTIPHSQFRSRAFVLAPAMAIAGDWRDPLGGLTLRHLHTRLTRPRPVPSCTPGNTPAR